MRTNAGKVECPQLRSVIVRPANKICKLETLYGWPVATCKHSVHPGFKQQAMTRQDKKDSFLLKFKVDSSRVQNFLLRRKEEHWVHWVLGVGEVAQLESQL